MTIPDLKPDFSLFFEANTDRLHFAAHSHHPWPDVSFEAQKQCWLDAAQYADIKWGKVFGDVIPKAQQHITRILNLPEAETIAFAPNTHEFVLRLLSCLPTDRPARVLTTDSEFHSFNRQIRRLEEDALLEVHRISICLESNYANEFKRHVTDNDYDLIFFSQIFFNAGLALENLNHLVNAVPNPDTLIVIDGYHGFMAVPTDLSEIADRAFYMAGGYKYAMAGEGVCFMHCPPGYALRPRNTGWFAGFSELESEQTDTVLYDPDGARFMGATFDPVGIYRFNAIQDWLVAKNITVNDIHAHVHSLQQRFSDKIQEHDLDLGRLVIPLSHASRGHFLTYETEQAPYIQQMLLENNIMTDSRGNRLRFGFGIYQDFTDVHALVDRISQTLEKL